MKIAAQVSRGLAIAKRVGVTAPVTVTRAASATYAPATDAPGGVSANSFTVDGVSESPKADQPMTGGLTPMHSTIWTVAAADCAFTPETGHDLTVNGVKSRVINVNATVVAGVATAYGIEVAS